MGFADTLFHLQIPYDSEEGLAFGEQIAKVMKEEGHAESERLAAVRGEFPNWKGSRWDVDWGGRKVRNACTTTIAPTGTISILANCSGGIEPLFSVAFFRNVLDGQRLPEVNDLFVQVAKERGFHSEALMEKLAEKGSVRSFPEIPEDVRRTFGVAMDVAPEWHVRMQAVYQKHNDASISKTINVPNEAPVEHVRRIYDLAYDTGCKGVTLYRDGCRKNQPMDLKRKDPARKDEAAAPAPAGPIVPISLPAIMPCVRVRQLTPFGNMHVKISVEGGSGIEREVFAQLGKGGDLANSDLEAMCRMLSLFLRCGGTLALAVQQLEGIGSSLSVPSRDGRIMSLADGLSKALRRYMRAKQKHGLRAILLGEVAPTELEEPLAALAGTGAAAPPGNANGTSAKTAFKVKCPDCGGVLAFEEGCVKCHGCGFSQC
jgi:ribonucleoside-diphosphate reductase alpha chain